MKSIKLNDDEDIDLTGGRASFVSDGLAAVQLVRQGLKIARGEYFMNKRLGLPLFEDILVRSPQVALIESLYIAEILSSPGITGLESLTLDVTPQRNLTVDFVASTKSGEIPSSLTIGV